MNSEAMSNFQYFFNKETKMSFSTSWLIFFVITNLIVISYFRQVALSSAVSEKDAHLAWLEVIIL